MRDKVKTLHKERKVGNKGGKGYMSLLGCWVNRYCAIYRAYNGARTYLLLYSAYYGNVQAMCDNVRQCVDNVRQCTAMCRLLLHATFYYILPGSDCTE